MYKFFKNLWVGGSQDGMQKVKEQSPVLQMCETSSLEGEGLTSATLGMSGDCETASTGASHSAVLR